jgi:hypothetical protein
MTGPVGAWSAHVMRGTTTKVRAAVAGLAAVALLGLAACGGDDDDEQGGTVAEAGGEGGAAAGPESGGDAGGEAPAVDEATPGAALDACGLLEKVEVEEAFGSFGAVADGVVIPRGCEWQVGEEIEGAVVRPTLSVQFAAHPDFPDFFPEGQAESQLDEVRGLPDTVVVPGLGDEALLDFGVLYVVEGDVVFAVAAYTIPNALNSVEATQAELVTLGEKVLSRM